MSYLESLCFLDVAASGPFDQARSTVVYESGFIRNTEVPSPSVARICDGSVMSTTDMYYGRLDAAQLMTAVRIQIFARSSQQLSMRSSRQWSNGYQAKVRCKIGSITAFDPAIGPLAGNERAGHYRGRCIGS